MTGNKEATLLTVALGIICLGAVGAPPMAFWQDEGHVLVNQAAAEQLPEEMPAFLRDAVDRLAYLGPEPDRWRRASEFTLKESQEPDHFIKVAPVHDD